MEYKNRSKMFYVKEEVILSQFRVVSYHSHTILKILSFCDKCSFEFKEKIKYTYSNNESNPCDEIYLRDLTVEETACLTPIL